LLFKFQKKKLSKQPQKVSGGSWHSILISAIPIGLAMPKFLAVLSLFVAVSSSQAQDWHHGTIVLKNGNSFTGEVSSPNYETVLFKLEDANMLFPSHKVKYFSYVDTRTSTFKTFESLHQRKGAASAYEFFEVIEKGTITLLRQEEIRWYSERQQTTVYNYFTLIDGNLIRLQEFRKYIYPQLTKSSEKIQRYTKQSHIRIYRIPDVARFIRFYNIEQAGLLSSK
jgi:hypothetical protein